MTCHMSKEYDVTVYYSTLHIKINPGQQIGQIIMRCHCEESKDSLIRERIYDAINLNTLCPVLTAVGPFSYQASCITILPHYLSCSDPAGTVLMWNLIMS